MKEAVRGVRHGRRNERGRRGGRYRGGGVRELGSEGGIKEKEGRREGGREH